MIAEPWNRVVQHWRDENISIRAGVSLDDIAAFEARYRVVLPPDVREYFMVVDGTGQEGVDEFLYRFWPLSEVKLVHEELTDSNPERFLYPDCFVFADHCISCWDYAVKLTADPDESGQVFKIMGDDRPGVPMCNSFREFMSRYADDPKNIF